MISPKEKKGLGKKNFTGISKEFTKFIKKNRNEAKKPYFHFWMIEKPIVMPIIPLVNNQQSAFRPSSL